MADPDEERTWNLLAMAAVWLAVPAVAVLCAALAMALVSGRIP